MEEDKKKHKCPFCPPNDPCDNDWCSWNEKPENEDIEEQPKENLNKN